jgi:acetyl esterase/lipase
MNDELSKDDRLLQDILTQQGHQSFPGVVVLPARPIRVVEGWTQQMHIWRPADSASRRPLALVYLHGGGFASGDPTGAGNTAKYLALTLGATTFAPSYRLASENNPTFPKPIDDVAAAWEWIHSNAAEFGLDDAPIALGGESAGGCLSSYALATGRVPGCAALLNRWGPVDFVARWYDRGEQPGAERGLLGCSYSENPTLYHQASPLTHLKPGLPPALFIYGRQDTFVHPRQGQLAHAAWQAHGAFSELWVYPNIGHGIQGDNRDSMAQVLRKTREFIEAHVRHLRLNAPP